MLTSTAFRLLFSSIVFYVRQGLAALAADVGEIAQQVEIAAGGVGQVANAVEKASHDVQYAVQVESVDEAVYMDPKDAKTMANDIAQDVVEQIDARIEATTFPDGKMHSKTGQALDPRLPAEDELSAQTVIVAQLQEVGILCPYFSSN